MKEKRVGKEEESVKPSKDGIDQKGFRRKSQWLMNVFGLDDRRRLLKKTYNQLRFKVEVGSIAQKC